MLIVRRQNGNDWEKIADVANVASFQEVWGTSADDVWLVGNKSGTGVVFHWDGNSWTNVTGFVTGPLGSTNFYGLWVGGNKVYAAGCSGVSSGLQGFSYNYDGTQWTWEGSSTGWPLVRTYFDIWGIGNELFIAAQSYGGPSDWAAEVIHYDGSSWKTKIFQEYHVANAVWGSSPDNVYIVSYGGSIFHYDGSIWYDIDSGTTESLGGVWGTGSGEVFAVGHNGTILHLGPTNQAPVSCFGVNNLKIGMKDDDKGNDVEIKGTFSPVEPIDFAVDDVLYVIDDGQEHLLEFLIEAGSFEVEGKPDDQKFKFDSPKDSEPDIKAKFDFPKGTFELKVKGVMNTYELVGNNLTVCLAAGANVVCEEVEARADHLLYESKPKMDCCPKCKGIALLEVTSDQGVFVYEPDEGKDELKANTTVDDGENGPEKIHTSCSKPIEIGDVHGAYTITDLVKIFD